MILIFTDNEDGSTNEVIEWLNTFKQKWFRINESDHISLNCILFENNSIVRFELKVNNHVIDLTKVQAFWYRRGYLNWVNRPKRLISKFEEIIGRHLELELKNIDDFVHQYLEKNKTGINSCTKGTNDKTYYQFVAMNSGLSVPDTIITTRKRDITDFHSGNTASVTKPINEALLFTHNGYGAFSKTTEVNDSLLGNLSDRFFPSLVQSYVAKFAELRIFFLHDQIYAMAIFSQQNEQTKLDFRNYDDERPNRNVPFDMPEDIKKKIILLMHTIELNCGSLDVILTPEGEYVFLEVNPVGQFGMVSQPCNYNLEKVIANYLSYGSI